MPWAAVAAALSFDSAALSSPPANPYIIGYGLGPGFFPTLEWVVFTEVRRQPRIFLSLEFRVPGTPIPEFRGHHT